MSDKKGVGRKHPPSERAEWKVRLQESHISFEQETKLNIENIEEFADDWLCVSETVAGGFESSSINRVLSQIREYMEV